MLTVIIRVLEGGDGSTSGGRSDKSRESGDLVPDDARDRCGDGIVVCTCMFAVVYVCARGGLCVAGVLDSRCGQLREQSRDSRVLYQSRLRVVGGSSFRKHVPWSSTAPNVGAQV